MVEKSNKCHITNISGNGLKVNGAVSLVLPTLAEMLKSCCGSGNSLLLQEKKPSPVVLHIPKM